MSLPTTVAIHLHLMVSCKLSSFQHPAQRHLYSKNVQDVLLGMGEQDIRGPVPVVGLTGHVPLGRNSTLFDHSFFESADGKLCTRYNRELFSKAKIKAIKYSMVIILGKQRPCLCFSSAWTFQEQAGTRDALVGSPEKKGFVCMHTHLCLIERGMCEPDQPICSPSKGYLGFLISLFINLALHQGPGVHSLEKI